MVDHDMGAIRGLPKDLLDASRKILEDEPVETGKNINPAGMYFPEAEKEEEELVEAYPTKKMSGKDIAKKMMKDRTMAPHAKKVAKLKSVSAIELDKMLPDYVSGGDIRAMFKEGAKKHSTGDKESYRDFVNKALKKFGVDSPAELSPEKKKEFYDYLDKNWIGDHEKDDPKAEAKDNEKEDQVHAPKKALEPMSTPNDENGKKKKKMKPEKVNTKPSMKGEEKSKRPLLVRER